MQHTLPKRASKGEAEGSRKSPELLMCSPVMVPGCSLPAREAPWNGIAENSDLKHPFLNPIHIFQSEQCYTAHLLTALLCV